MEKVKLLVRSTPEAQGIPSAAILAFVRAAENIHDLHSFMLLRHGVVVAEAWWQPYRAERPHVLFSLSKSFLSTAIGLAVEAGHLRVDEPVLKFFAQDEAPRVVGPHLAAMQVRHLLTMTSGHGIDTFDKIIFDENPARAFLALPLEHAPGSHFAYNSGASYMLAAIIQKLTGQTVMEYLTPRLFEPLGIEGAWWDSHPNGVNLGAIGLNIKTEDIARFGQLYLQEGIWEGRQLVPVEWVRAATSRQVDNAPNPNPDWGQGYGYQFWRCRHNAYRGDGAFGQFCVVFPEQDAVLAITGGLPDMQPVLDAVWETLLPAMQPAALSADPVSVGQLADTLRTLKLDPPPAGPVPSAAERFSGQTYLFDANAEGLEWLCFDFRAGTLQYRLLGGSPRGDAHTLHFGAGAWVDDRTYLDSPTPAPVVGSGAWTADDTFVLTLRYYETPFIATFTCRFARGEIFIKRRYNVGFGLNLPVTFMGQGSRNEK